MEVNTVLTQKSIAQGETSFEEVGWVEVGERSNTPYVKIQSYRRNYTLYGQEKEHENFAYVEIPSWDTIKEILSCVGVRLDSSQTLSYTIDIPNAVGVYKHGESDDVPIAKAKFCIEEQYVSLQVWSDGNDYLGCATAPIHSKIEDGELGEEDLLTEFKEMIRSLTKWDETRPQSQTTQSGGKSQSEEKEYDVFISHSSADKDEIARPLYKELQDRGHNVWFDESVIDNGDFLVSEINQGLALSDHGVVLLSHDFFDSNWTKTELAALVTAHIKHKDMLIPFRHNITINEIESQNPILASMKISSTDGRDIGEIADDIENKMKG